MTGPAGFAGPASSASQHAQYQADLNEHVQQGPAAPQSRSTPSQHPQHDLDQTERAMHGQAGFSGPVTASWQAPDGSDGQYGPDSLSQHAALYSNKQARHGPVGFAGPAPDAQHAQHGTAGSADQFDPVSTSQHAGHGAPSEVASHSPTGYAGQADPLQSPQRTQRDAFLNQQARHGPVGSAGHAGPAGPPMFTPDMSGLPQHAQHRQLEFESGSGHEANPAQRAQHDSYSYPAEPAPQAIPAADLQTRQDPYASLTIRTSPRSQPSQVRHPQHPPDLRQQNLPIPETSGQAWLAISPSGRSTHGPQASSHQDLDTGGEQHRGEHRDGGLQEPIEPVGVATAYQRQDPHASAAASHDALQDHRDGASQHSFRQVLLLCTTVWLQCCRLSCLLAWPSAVVRRQGKYSN